MPTNLTAPHAAPPKKYIHTGIGGAGNYHRYAAVATASPAAMPSQPSAQPRPFAAGRGGAGNKYLASEQAMFSFDEELAQQRRGLDAVAPVYHVGRGGAGNLMDERRRLAEKERTGSVSSGGSGGSEKSEKTGWIREKLGRGPRQG
ncbi:hypothetical protein MMC13_000074 [Lambiella insularis]|nr:hypothetical protein [Lambiella insularis]